jgi:macrodomain Ter protein organizer (MatP/YcbG family)
MASGPKITSDNIVDIVRNLDNYLIRNSVFSDDRVPRRFVDANYTEYAQNKHRIIVSMETTYDSMDLSFDFKDRQEKEREKIEGLLSRGELENIPDEFIAEFKKWIIDEVGDKWGSFLSAERQRKHKRSTRKAQITLSREASWRIKDVCERFDMTIDQAIMMMTKEAMAKKQIST